VRVGGFSGDVAYGGNWFFLIDDHGQHLERANVDALTDFTWRARLAANAGGFPEVDHVILYEGTRNFVLCPGKAYDRSPCGTGTSARLACLAADGRLAEGESLVQESIVGSIFTASYRWLDRTVGTIAPTITGTAFISAEATLLFDERDPFRHGIPPLP
jgi:proline racemase